MRILKIGCRFGVNKTLKKMTYNYGCETCKDTVEVSHAMTEKPKVKCDKCGGERKKWFSAPMLNKVNGVGGTGTTR